MSEQSRESMEARSSDEQSRGATGAEERQAREGDGLSTADVAFGRNQAEQQTQTRDTQPAQGSSSSGTATSEESPPLLTPEQTSAHQGRWQGIQTKFVDEPQASVREADQLVAEVMQQVAARFAEEREKLEKAWSSGSDVSTEDLRKALQHYRSFFQRLLSA